MQISDLAYIDATGYHYADYPSFLDFIQSSFKSIYGNDIVLDSSTQDGQLCAVFAQALYDVSALGAAVTASFSPTNASGVGLARLVKLNGLSKIVATKSTVDLLIGGTVGTTITSGVAIDTLNQKWNLPTTVVIPNSGAITVTATADIAGAVSAGVNSVNRIYSPTQGWQSVTNPNQATVGVATEKDSVLRARQTVSTALPSLTVFEGTKGAVANVTGVTKSRGYENDTASTDANGIPAHMISMVVLGGSAADIAQVIARHKTPGGGTYGSTTVPTYDSHGMPLNINFFRPTISSIQVSITIQTLYGYSTGYNALIAQAVADLINGLSIGDSVSLSKLYVPANLPSTAPGTTFNIATLQIGKNGGALASANVPIAFNELAQCNPLTDVTITVVQ